MRKLNYTINWKHMQRIKPEIVPTIFTEHQFDLIRKRFTNKRMSNSEKNEFSRTISRKMKAINRIMGKDAVNVYGKDKIPEQKLRLATKYLKRFSRKFKNKHIIISGSFLYKHKYNDIDIFVVSKHDKEDYHIDKFHINYLAPDVYNSLFFASLSRLCISNKSITSSKITEPVNIDTFISLYQELFNDLDRRFKGVRAILRQFLLQAAVISKSPIPDSLELRQQIDSILKLKHPKQLIKKLFVKSIVLGINPKRAVAAMRHMIRSYKDVIKEYKKHKLYYLDLIQAFKEVIVIES